MRGGLVASARLLPRPLVRWFLQRRAQQDINENMLGGKKVVLEVEKELSAAILTMIDTIIKEGKIVPSEITIKLLQEAIIKGGNDKYIIDGFPRNEENRVVFESVEEMERRLLGRNQGRSDDNIETIRKRLKVFVESSLPVIEYYESKGMVKKIIFLLK
uniref:adenylate kinase n=1 Tax=Oryza glumipatula TaxID=40148 RepID=A0A0E0A6F9_9ORYZ